MGIVDRLTDEGLVEKSAAMKEIANRRYTWKVIARKYVFLVEQVLVANKKMAVSPDSSDLHIQELLNMEMGHLANPSFFYEKR
jgi:hypothetical protein